MQEVSGSIPLSSTKIQTLASAGVFVFLLLYSVKKDFIYVNTFHFVKFHINNETFLVLKTCFAQLINIVFHR